MVVSFDMAKARISVEKNGNESSSGLLKRFSRKVSSSGILRTAKAGRFATRPKSAYQKKKSALRRIERYEDKKVQMKLGKIFANPRKSF